MVEMLQEGMFAHFTFQHKLTQSGEVCVVLKNLKCSSSLSVLVMFCWTESYNTEDFPEI